MTDSKICAVHRQRQALVYVRQSSPAQVEQNRESTRRQYALADRARDLGWHSDQITIVDEDLGLSGSSADGRSGFARMTAEVALGQIGILLGLEVSRLARNNADWYRLLDLCGLTDTLIADADGIYHPGLFNDSSSWGSYVMPYIRAVELSRVSRRGVLPAVACDFPPGKLTRTVRLMSRRTVWSWFSLTDR